MVKKVIEAKGKTLFQLHIIIQELNQYYFRRFQLANTTIAKTNTPNSFMKDPKIKKPKVQALEITTFQYANNKKTSKKT